MLCRRDDTGGKGIVGERRGLLHVAHGGHRRVKGRHQVVKLAAQVARCACRATASATTAH